MITKVRPQIMVALVCATLTALFISWLGYKLGAIEVLTGVLGAVFGFFGGVTLKVLENE
jgi:high-affinity Fe2+/Pb2+ permease